MMGWFLLIVLLLLLWCLLLVCRRSWPRWDRLLPGRYAHRGYHDKPRVPENSLAAFRRAVERGYGAELDVHLMQDGGLAVIHDSSLQRTAGADVRIEDLCRTDLARYPLEQSNETIPLLEDVLALFRDKAPLVIELKPERGNHKALSAAVAAVLDGYSGDYCIESFDPRVLYWFRKHRPQVCRGQLAYNFLADRESELPWLLKLILTNLLTNFLTRPDFIAYQFSDRRVPSLRLCKRLWHPKIFYWTITSQTDLDTAEGEQAAGIFERFCPREDR